MGTRKQVCTVWTCLSIYLLVSMSCSWGSASAAQDQKKSLSLQNSIEGTIDDSLVTPSGNDVQQVLYGVGDQIYALNGTDWNLMNVSANLYNFRGNRVGYHFFLAEQDSNGGQATWEIFKPFSRVTTKTLSQVPQEDAIAWLLNVATSNSGSRKQFGSTTFVQRLYTIDGQAPLQLGKAGDIYKSSYSAMYTFSSKNKEKV